MMKHAKSNHLPGVDTEEEVDGPSSCSLLEGLVQALVSWIRRAPDLVLERLVHVVLSVRLDDEVPRLYPNSISADDIIRWMLLTKAGLVSKSTGLYPFVAMSVGTSMGELRKESIPVFWLTWLTP